MIKFVLGLIALVFIGLALYVYTDKENKQPNEYATQTTVKTETPSVKEEVSVVEPKVVKKTTPAVEKAVKQGSVEVVNVSRETADTSNSEKIGKGLTLEGIEAMDISDEEKEVLKNDMLYYQNSQNTDDGLDFLQNEALIKDDIEKGLIP